MPGLNFWIIIFDGLDAVRVLKLIEYKLSKMNPPYHIIQSQW
jgi:hypothetical protein